MMKMKIKNKIIIIFQILIAIMVAFIVSAMTPKIIHSFNESLSYYNQQTYSNALLQTELLNTSSSIKETTINVIINSPGCKSLFNNITNG